MSDTQRMKIKLTPSEWEAIFMRSSIYSEQKLKRENPLEVTAEQAREIALDAKAAAEMFEGPGFSSGTRPKDDAKVWRRIQKKFEALSLPPPPLSPEALP